MSEKKNGSVGRIFLIYIFSTQTTEMHILVAVFMLHQHKFCDYKGKRKLKVTITCENFALNAILISVFMLLCKYIF